MRIVSGVFALRPKPSPKTAAMRHLASIHYLARLVAAALCALMSISLTARQGNAEAGPQAVAQSSQELGSLDVTITDPTGAVLPDAHITLIAPDGRRTTSLTNSNGQRHFSGLSPGNYTIVAARQGFLESSRSIEVQKGTPTTMSMALSIDPNTINDWPGRYVEPVLIPTIDPSYTTELTPYKILPLKKDKKRP